MKYEQRNQELAETLKPEIIASPEGIELCRRFDVSTLLEETFGENWHEALVAVTEGQSIESVRDANDPTCREDNPDQTFKQRVTSGDEIISRMPELWRLYHNEFRELMLVSLSEDVETLRAYTDNPTSCMEAYSSVVYDPDDASEHRMEAHCDQRYTAILVIESPEPGAHGELVIANKPGLSGVAAIEGDGTTLQHTTGTLVCFPRGRELAHFTKPIISGKRIIISINYPVDSESEEETERITDYIESGKQQA